jgi:hypothetical protein
MVAPLPIRAHITAPPPGNFSGVGQVDIPYRVTVQRSLRPHRLQLGRPWISRWYIVAVTWTASRPRLPRVIQHHQADVWVRLGPTRSLSNPDPKRPLRPVVVAQRRAARQRWKARQRPATARYEGGTNAGLSSTATARGTASIRPFPKTKSMASLRSTRPGRSQGRIAPAAPHRMTGSSDRRLRQGTTECCRADTPIRFLWNMSRS